jgi:hypothetical protein
MQIMIYISMVKLISNFKYVMFLIATGLFVGVFTFLILSLPGIYRDTVSVFILPPAIAAIFTLISFTSARKLRMSGKRLARSLGLFFIMAYIMLESIFVIITFHTIEALLLLIPADLVLMSIPLFILFSRGKKQEGLEFNSDLTSRLQSMLGTNAPEVYTKAGVGLMFGGSTDDEPWKIIIYKHALESLNDDELDMLMLEIYYKKLLKTGRKTVNFAFSLVTFLFDAYIALYVVDMNVAPVYTLYFIGAELGLFIVILLIPLIFSRVAMKGNIAVDKQILSHNGNRMALISLINRENDREPATMMTQRQYDRLKAKQKMNAKKRIENLDVID